MAVCPESSSKTVRTSVSGRPIASEPFHRVSLSATGFRKVTRQSGPVQTTASPIELRVARAVSGSKRPSVEGPCAGASAMSQISLEMFKKFEDHRSQLNELVEKGARRSEPQAQP